MKCICPHVFCPVMLQLSTCRVQKVETGIVWVSSSPGTSKSPGSHGLSTQHFAQSFLGYLANLGVNSPQNYRRDFWKHLSMMRYSIHNTHMLLPENLHFNQSNKILLRKGRSNTARKDVTTSIWNTEKNIQDSTILDMESAPIQPWQKLHKIRRVKSRQLKA